MLGHFCSGPAETTWAGQWLSKLSTFSPFETDRWRDTARQGRQAAKDGEEGGFDGVMGNTGISQSKKVLSHIILG